MLAAPLPPGHKIRATERGCSSSGGAWCGAWCVPLCLHTCATLTQAAFGSSAFGSSAHLNMSSAWAQACKSALNVMGCGVWEPEIRRQGGARQREEANRRAYELVLQVVAPLQFRARRGQV